MPLNSYFEPVWVAISITKFAPIDFKFVPLDRSNAFPIYTPTGHNFQKHSSPLNRLHILIFKDTIADKALWFI